MLEPHPSGLLGWQSTDRSVGEACNRPGRSQFRTDQQSALEVVWSWDVNTGRVRFC